MKLYFKVTHFKQKLKRKNNKINHFVYLLYITLAIANDVHSNYYFFNQSLWGSTLYREAEGTWLFFCQTGLG